MNCKPGDLAIIIKADGDGIPGQISRKLVGHIVRVVKLVKPSDEFHCYADLVWRFEEPILIVIDGRKYSADGMADDALRPIRDNDGEDETLTWAGKPHKETA